MASTVATLGTVAVNGTNTSAGSTTSVAWTDPANALDDIGDNTAYKWDHTKAGNTGDLLVSGFGFSIPTNATIDGIEVTIRRKQEILGDTTPYTTDTYIGLFNYTSSSTYTAVGTNQATADLWPTTFAVAAYGGPTSLWGATTAELTPAFVNSASFAFGIAASYTGGQNVEVQPHVDWAKVTIYYTDGDGGGGPTGFAHLDSQTSGLVNVAAASGNFLEASGAGYIRKAGTEGSGSLILDANGNIIRKA